MKICQFFAATVVLIAVVGFSSAQDDSGPLARMFMVDVKTGQAVAFESGLKAHIEWRRQQRDPWEWSVYQVVNGSQLGDYILRSGSHNWEDFDGYQAFLDRGAPHFFASVGSTVNALTSTITSVDLEHLRWPEDPGAVNLISITTYKLIMGRQQMFNEVVVRAHEAIEKTDWPVYYAWEFVMNGGEPGTATLASPFASWAEMEPPLKSFPAVLAEAFGEKEASRLLEKIGEATASADTSVIRFRPDLSLLQQQ